MHVYLTGFMGAGKTTVGRILAERMGRPFVDLDRRIEEKTGMTITEIFGEQGEAAFRRLERECLTGLPDETPAVVALGGGVQTLPENRIWLAEHGTTVWIDPPFEALAARVAREGQWNRPLFASEQKARELYVARLVDYDDSDLRIEVSSTSPAELVAAIIHGLLEETECVT